MNYRHAFHAGNFADVHKHSVLARILLYLRRKPNPFRVIDTHAGAGVYDLLGPEAARSGEWRDGIARVWPVRKFDEAAAQNRGQSQSQAPALLAPYLDAVAALNPDGRLRHYPGSPLIIGHLLRRKDRVVACEAEPGAAGRLMAALRGDRRAKALAIDGWTAARAYVPPKERRGLVFVDPPFEEVADFQRLSDVLELAQRKWPTGIYMLWYPIKDRSAPDTLARQLSKRAARSILRCEIMRGPPRADGGLVGSGLIVVNPPFTLAPELNALMPMLCGLLSPDAWAKVDWLVSERSPAR